MSEILITLNGKKRTLPENSTVADLIEETNSTRRFAVELNENIVPHKQYALQILKQDDHLEIVQAIGGG